MGDALRLLPVIVRNWLKTRAQLQFEILALRHQLSVLQREQDRRPRFTTFDRIFWVCLYRLWPGCLDALAIMKPETVVRWHRRLQEVGRARLPDRFLHLGSLILVEGRVIDGPPSC